MSTYNLGRILPIYRGKYESGETYNKLDIVYVDGLGSFVAKQTITGIAPTYDNEFWQVVAKDLTNTDLVATFESNEQEREQRITDFINTNSAALAQLVESVNANVNAKLNTVDEFINTKGNEIEVLETSYTNTFNAQMQTQRDTFEQNETNRNNQATAKLNEIENADVVFKNSLKNDVDNYINTTDVVFTESQNERTATFNANMASQMGAFNSAQSARTTAFESAQTQRANEFTSAQNARTNTFNASEQERADIFAATEQQRETDIAIIAQESARLNDMEERKANRDDYCVEFTAGLAENIISPDGVIDTAPYIFRTSAGEQSINTGNAEIKSLYGHSIVWNQLFNNDRNGWISSFGSHTINDDGSITLEANFLSGSNIVGKPLVKGHKYYLSITGYVFDDGNNYLHLYGNNNTIINSTLFFTTTKERKDVIFTLTQDVEEVSHFWSTLEKKNISNIMLFDLTKMFGEGNEPTIEQFKQWFPNDYYEYNAGEIINVNVDGLKTVGFNQWDEEWELGMWSYDNFVKLSVPNRIRCKNAIIVKPNTTYCIKHNKKDCYVMCFDNTQKYITRYYFNPIVNYSTFTTPNNCHLITFFIDGVTTYNNDICINYSWSGYRNGDYEPYQEHNINIPVKEIKDADNNVLFPDGLLGTIDGRDTITSDKATKIIKSVDLSTLEWRYSGRYFFAPLVDAVPYSIGICDRYISYKYPPYTDPSRISDKSFIFNSYMANGGLNIKDTQYTDATTFKNSLNGVMLYYVSATPIEVEFKDVPQSFGDKLNLTYFVDDFGTEEFTTNEPTAPVKHSTFYMTNLRDKIRNIDGNTDAGALMNSSLDNLLSTLGNALNGTLSKQWDASNKKWQFTFTPNQTNQLTDGGQQE